MNSFPDMIKDRKSAVNNYLNRLFSTDDKYASMLFQCMEYSINAGGKRLRPVIILLVWEMLTGRDDYEKIMPVAASVEMVHTYSLIHDDLPAMDNDDLRRGRPTLHKKYNEAVAILSGDALFSYALEVFLRASVDEKKLIKGMQFFLRHIGPQGIVAGQFIDTEIDRFQRNEETLKYIHNNKTAALISACFALPGILHGANQDAVDILKNAGMKAGLLFQIIDDILDIESNPEVLGKSVSKDIMQDKLTYMTFFSPAEAKKKAQKKYEETLSTISLLNYDTSMLKEMVDYFYKRMK